MHWRQYLRIQTQDPPFLWRMVLGILAIGGVIGYAVQSLATFGEPVGSARITMAASQGENERALTLLEEILADDQVAFEEVLKAVAGLARQQRRLDQTSSNPGATMPAPRVVKIEETEVLGRIDAAPLSADKRRLLRTLWNSAIGDNVSLDELRSEALAKPPSRFSNHALGLLYESVNQTSRAANAYEREGQFPEAKESRERAMRLYASADDTSDLRRLIKRPEYADVTPTYALMSIAAEEGDWASVFWLIPRNEAERFALGPAALALFTGLCWFLFASQAGQVDEQSGARWWLCGLAVPLGVLSIWATHFFILWQEVQWGLVESSDVAGGLRFFIFGVGFREELAKLLLLLPLVPFLVKRGSELEVLIVSSCVGLGFAVLENEHYFSASYGSSTLGRFLTANFFHMAATGLIGLALVRGIWDPRTRAPETIGVFGIVVLAHGLYDAAISIPAFQEFSIFSSIIFILLAYQYFHELRSMRSQRQETVSLTANFLCGVSLLTAVTFVYLSAQFDFEMAALILAPEALSMALMAYMFLREMPNSLMGAR